MTEETQEEENWQNHKDHMARKIPVYLMLLENSGIVSLDKYVHLLKLKKKIICLWTLFPTAVLVMLEKS